MTPRGDQRVGASLSGMDRTLALTGDGEKDRGDPVRAGGVGAMSFARLYEAHLTGLYRYFLAHTGNEGDAADLSQQVFVQALAAWPRYQGGIDTVRPWLFQIAH